MQVIYDTKIGFIGLGKLGMPCAEAMAKKGFDVAGYDIKESSTINNSLEMIQAMSSYQLFTKKEYSPLKKLFTGLDQTSTECKICGNKKSNFQTFPIWQLPIPVNEKNLNREFDITECMDKWMETEELDDENRLLCQLVFSCSILFNL